MYNTYRFVTKLWLPCSGEAGKTLRKVIANKNRQCQQNQKVPLIFFNHSHIRIAYSQWVVRSYPNMGMIEKKLEVLFGFCDTENLDFGTT